MRDAELYRAILGLESPWIVARVDLDVKQQRVDVYAEHGKRKTWPCPECEASCGLQDHDEERTWRHLDSCQFRPTCMRASRVFAATSTAYGRCGCRGQSRDRASHCCSSASPSTCCSPLVKSTRAGGGDVLAKPWAIRPARPGLYSKADFRLDLRRQTVTCPAGQVEIFELGTTVHFDPDVCGPCPRREHCTHAASGSGRSISIAEDEDAQKSFRRLQGLTRRPRGAPGARRRRALPRPHLRAQRE